MAQLFSRNSNTFFRLGILFAALTVAGSLTILWLVFNSSYINEVSIPPEQPVPFSHEHHVRGLGIDCRYCHTSVETSAFAGIPAPKTCMTCHSQIWTNAELLEPVRQAYRTNKPIEWVKVHKMPNYVYFNHSIHIAKGVACTTCHGPIDRMPLTWKHVDMSMSWCLSCHRRPEKFIGAKTAVFKSHWIDARKEDRDQFIDLAKAELPPDMKNASPAEIRKALVQHRKIPSVSRMTECYVCHR